MMKTARIIGIALVLTAFVAGSAFGADTKNYTSEEDRFSIQYPAHWYFGEEDDGYGFFSSEKFEDGEGDGAAVYIRVQELPAEYATDLEKLFGMVMSELNSDIKLEEIRRNTFAGEEWVSAQFGIDEIPDAEAYCTIHEFKVYLIAIGYSEKNGRNTHERTVRGILNSFKFSQIEYKKYDNRESGISFMYPSHWDLQDSGDQQVLIMSAENASPPDDVMAGIGVMFAPSDIPGMTEEQMLEQLVNSGPGMEIVQGPEKRTILGKSWTYVEISDEKFKGTIAILTQGDTIYVIVSVVNPLQLESEAEAIFEKFMSTLKISTLN